MAMPGGGGAAIQAGPGWPPRPLTGPPDLPYFATAAMAARGSSGTPQDCNMFMELSTVQTLGIGSHLFSINAMTGANLLISPTGPDIFQLTLVGSEKQILDAQGMLLNVLGQPTLRSSREGRPCLR